MLSLTHLLNMYFVFGLATGVRDAFSVRSKSLFYLLFLYSIFLVQYLLLEARAVLPRSYQLYKACGEKLFTDASYICTVHWLYTSYVLIQVHRTLEHQFMLATSEYAAGEVWCFG
jgi:hypothetical protein